MYATAVRFFASYWAVFGDMRTDPKRAAIIAFLERGLSSPKRSQHPTSSRALDEARSLGFAARLPVTRRTQSLTQVRQFTF
jgi:hypothetical protein